MPPFHGIQGLNSFECTPRLLIRSKEFSPADLVLLASSNDEGLCYIETSNLDGESNLKTRRALEQTWKYIDCHTASNFTGRWDACQGLFPKALHILLTLEVSERRSYKTFACLEHVTLDEKTKVGHEVFIIVFSFVDDELKCVIRMEGLGGS
eukprot:Gb_18233 [translate_table: standard]